MHSIRGFMKAFSEGDSYPRWTDESNLGLGAPLFVLYPPLTSYGAAAASWLAGSVFSGMKLLFFVVAALTALAFYWLAREWIGPGVPAALAAALYLLLPYHVLDMYYRFALQETTSFIFFPLILLFARRTMEGGRRGAFAGLALSYAGLLFTHIVSSYTFSLFLGPWLLWEARRRWATLARPVLAMACGAGLSTVTLLPAAVEKSFANVAWVREMPNGDYRINFIFKDPVLPILGFKDPVKPPVLKSAHSQLLLAGLAALAALAWLPRDDRRRRDAAALAVISGAAYLIQLEISTPIWEIVPELPTIQFPFRFQTLQVLAAPLLAGIALHAAGSAPAGGSRPVKVASKDPARAPLLAIAPILGLLGLAAGLNLLLAWQTAHLKPFIYDEEMNSTPGVTGWIEPSWTPVEFTIYKTFKWRPVRLPRWSFLEGQGQVQVLTWVSSRRLLEVSSAAGGTVMLGSFWFPGWTGWLDGTPLELRPASVYGTVTFKVPPGTHTVEMRFEATPLRRLAAVLSMVFVGVTAVLAWWAPRLPGP